METTNIIQTIETIVESATQPLLEKIDEVGRQIQDSLIDGAVDQATEAIRNLSTWFEDTIWEAYLTSLLQCEEILAWLRALGARKSPPFCFIPGDMDHVAHRNENTSQKSVLRQGRPEAGAEKARTAKQRGASASLACGICPQGRTGPRIPRRSVGRSDAFV